MKKKASFLISGITTAALVVTAIGSFAAWDTLTETDQFSAISGSPAVLTVASTSEGFTNKTLVPVGALKGTLNGTTDVEVLTGTFTPTLTEGKSADITFVDPVVKLAGTVDAALLETKIYEMVGEGKTEVAVGGALTSGTEYTIEVKYAANSETIADAALAAGKTITVDLTCVANKKVEV